MNFVATTIDNTGTGETDPFELAGYCDIWVLGLTAGSVKLQVIFPDEKDGVDPERDYPDAVYTAATVNSIFISEKAVMGKLVATGVNEGVYLRLARHYNN